MKRFDRMHHPISHTAAIVAGTSFIVLVTVVWLGAGIPRARFSPTWWAVGVSVALALASSLVTYFKPHGGWALVPLGLAGVVLLGLCAWVAWGVFTRGDVGRAHQPVIFLVAWVVWARHKYRQYRKARSDVAPPPGRPRLTGAQAVARASDEGRAARAATRR